MKLQGSVEAIVRIEREVLADDLNSGKALLEQEVYGALHGIAGVTTIRIELVHVETNPQVSSHDEDVRTVSRFITGWWPGLEDGINWPTPEDPNEHPIYAAAKRLQR